MQQRLPGHQPGVARLAVPGDDAAEEEEAGYAAVHPPVSQHGDGGADLVHPGIVALEGLEIAVDPLVIGHKKAGGGQYGAAYKEVLAVEVERLGPHLGLVPKSSTCNGEGSFPWRGERGWELRRPGPGIDRFLAVETGGG